MSFESNYTLEAIRRGKLVIAAKSEKDICYIVHLDGSSSIKEFKNLIGFFKIDEHIGTAYTGLEADSRVLIKYSREQAQNYRRSYNEPIPVKILAKKVASICENYSQFAMIRPFGCALLFIGLDSLGSHLFINSHDGDFRSYNSYSIGFNSPTANHFLSSYYKEKMSFNELIDLLLFVLDMSIYEKVTKYNFKIGYLKSDEGSFKSFDIDDNEDLLKNFKIPSTLEESFSQLKKVYYDMKKRLKEEELNELIIERKYLIELFDEKLIIMEHPEFLPTLSPLVVLVFEKHQIEITYDKDLVIFRKKQSNS